MKTVRELCREIKGVYNIEGNDGVEITGISADSREIERGDLFVCIAGAHVDGAVFAGQAAEKGAVAVLTTTSRSAAAGYADYCCRYSRGY
ncbi:Mur ligase family, catalytic domain protein [Anaeroglobus geminatus F0357]|uniref:Mur ligase family, catalytic domain protein n=1 Tax=Anaeroglobus geminatus F0357 TaxID=861450 RepID=G9YI46_9FIRM|nr:Mur ligase family, catalytic domain protein [Anaeroglobus geminatus F0357]